MASGKGKRQVRVTVTGEDIERGGYDCDNCPVSRGLRRGFKRLGMRAGHARYWREHGLAEEEFLGPEGDFPGGVTSWIEAYDAGEVVGPFSFVVEVEEE